MPHHFALCSLAMTSTASTATEGLNADQSRYWNGAFGKTWAEHSDALDRAYAELTARLLQAGAPELGDAVLDVGCGTGAVTFAVGEQTGLFGRAVGLDISSVILDHARLLAVDKYKDASGARFVLADAMTWQEESEFDLVISRFGLMFFDDPVRGLSNLAQRVRPNGGRLAFVCWRPPLENDWVRVPRQALVSALLPDVPPLEHASADAPYEPGMFSLADADRVRGFLAASGWRDVTCEALDVDLLIGKGARALDEACDFLASLGPTARLMRDSGVDGEAARAVLTDCLINHFVRDDEVRVPAAVWLFTARRGAA